MLIFRLPKAGIFTGLDEGAFELRVQQLKDSGLFTQAFLDNYTKIGHEIHRRLRTKEMIYEAGYTPPTATARTRGPTP